MAKLPTLLPANPHGHQYASSSAYKSSIHQGDVYNYGPPTSQHKELDEIAHYGLCLASAPLLEPSDFVGRAAEIDSIQQTLRPCKFSTERQLLVLGGIGGIGKTQLAIAYARRHRASYTSTFWLNATSELTLKASFRSLTGLILRPEELEALDDEQALARALAWLSNTRNTQWLLIFDNYNDPDRFDIRKYYPYAGHGSIIITTRLPDLVGGQVVRVQPLTSIEVSLDILQTRSRRDNVKDNPAARCLAERMEGLPLALATAGAYLSRSNITFQQYLEKYHQCWNFDTRRSLRLQEYQNRTLYTTWNLSYNRLETDDPDAAHMLKLLAYFDNQEVWYDLLRAGMTEDLPAQLQVSLSDQFSFDSVMRTLVEYCILEVQSETQSYSMHSCVHDWTLGALNRVIEPRLYWYAFECIAASINEDDQANFQQLRYARMARHGIRLTHHRFAQDEELKCSSVGRCRSAVRIAELLANQGQLSAAEQMYIPALVGFEKALGPDHLLTLNTVGNLGILYYHQGKLDEAERMFLRVLDGREKALGPDHISALEAVDHLGILYSYQDKLDEAERMHIRALAGREKAFGPDHTSTLKTVNHLGTLHKYQGKLRESERMYIRALVGFDKALGPDHPLTLSMLGNLGILYCDQGKLDEAERMFLRALAGKEKALGPDHTSTLGTVDHLGTLYSYQGKLDDAERMHIRALAGREKAFGPDHTSTLKTVNNLGTLHKCQGKLHESERMYIRALVGFDKALGPGHTSTLNTINNLGILYRDQGKLDEAEQVFLRALIGREEALGPDHLLTINTVSNLGILYRNQGKLDESEQMYMRALAGFERAVGPDHPSTLNTVGNLGILFRDQGELNEAERMFLRALTGFEKTLGREHNRTHEARNLLATVRLQKDKTDGLE